MRRRLVVTAVWVAGTIVAIVLSTSAVGMVGRRVSGGQTAMVSRSGVEQALAQSSDTSSTTAGTEPALPPESALDTTGSPVPEAPAGSSAGSGSPASIPSVDEPPAIASESSGSEPMTATEEVYTTRGGTVAVRCVGTSIGLLFATPASGWRIHGSASTGPVEVEVRFEPALDARGTEVRVRVACQAGVPVEEIRDEG